MVSFTTEAQETPRRPRSVSIIRDRCLNFMKILKENGYTHSIPLEDAKHLFFLTIGLGDRKSQSAYFGTQASRSLRRIRKIARYSTGTVSFKDIELAQEISGRPGYFELLRLATFELRGKTWFMILSDEALVPELGPQHYEGSRGSNVNFSLPPQYTLHLTLRRGGVGELPRWRTA